jgi:hypothetical protein
MFVRIEVYGRRVATLRYLGPAVKFIAVVETDRASARSPCPDSRDGLELAKVQLRQISVVQVLFSDVMIVMNGGSYYYRRLMLTSA